MNTFLTPRAVALDALRILQAMTLFKELVYNNFDKEFVAKRGSVIMVRNPAKFHSNNFDGQIEVQDIEEGDVEVHMDRLRDVSVALDSTDVALSLQSFSEQITKPAMIRIAQDVDKDIAAAIAGFAGSEVKATDDPTNLEDIAKLGEALDNNLAPGSDRSLVFAVKHKYAYALTDNLSLVSYAGDNRALRDAILGRIYGFDTYMSQNCVNSLSKEKGTATGYKVTGNKGNKFVALSTVAPSGGTVKAGEGFIFDGHLYRFTQDQNASGTDVSRITIDEKLHKNITSGDTILLVNKPISVAFHKEGVAFVTRPLEKPEGAAKSYVASEGGLSVRVTFDYDINKKQDVVSFDVLYGIAELNKDLIVRLA